MPGNSEFARHIRDREKRVGIANKKAQDKRLESQILGTLKAPVQKDGVFIVKKKDMNRTYVHNI